MALTAIVFDLGWMLVDETRQLESPDSAVSKPAPEFFTRVAQELARPPHEIAYVGDRVDNDIAPALAFGMQAVHIRRGPYGSVHEAPAGARRIDSLLELVA